VRRLIFASLSFLIAMTGIVDAAEVSRDTAPGTVKFRDSRPGDDREEGPRPRRTTRSGRYYYRVVLWDQAQGFCIAWRSTTDKAYADSRNAIGFDIRFDRGTGALLLDCPRRATSPPAAAPDGESIAAAAWEQVENLPVPTLDIEPDYAITGKKVFLQIHGPTTWTTTIDNPIGDDIKLSATSHYVVDWGDPTYGDKTVTESQGGPWPEGDVTHVYTHTSKRTLIRVTQRWTATWETAAASGGVLPELTTEAPPLELEVRQLQAVRDR
jgi:hypothetical protein